MSIHYSCTQTERGVYKTFRSRTRFYSGIRGQGCRGRLGVAFGVRGKRLPQLRVQSSSESLSECLFPGTNTPAPQNQAHGGSAKYRHWGSCSCRGARCSVTASRIPHPAPPCPPHVPQAFLSPALTAAFRTLRGESICCLRRPSCPAPSSARARAVLVDLCGRAQVPLRLQT